MNSCRSTVAYCFVFPVYFCHLVLFFIKYIWSFPCQNDSTLPEGNISRIPEWRSLYALRMQHDGDPHHGSLWSRTHQRYITAQTLSFYIDFLCNSSTNPVQTNQLQGQIFWIYSIDEYSKRAKTLLVRVVTY